MKKLLALLAVVLGTGCAGSEVHELDPTWRPLKEIREKPVAVGSDTAITTIGETAYVTDLDEWLGRVPPGSAKYKAILRHEQEHSRRQLAYPFGFGPWIARYATDKKFALEEEQIGYYYEITERRRLGDVVIPEAYAGVLSRYKVLGSHIISYADALAWVQAVLNGQWTPPN